MKAERIVLRAKYKKHKKTLEQIIQNLLHERHTLRGLNRELVARIEVLQQLKVREELEGTEGPGDVGRGDTLIVTPTAQETT